VAHRLHGRQQGSGQRARAHQSYHDYGTFTPIQVASIVALEGPQECVEEHRLKYQKRRDVMVRGLHEAGWMVDNPGLDVHLAKIPEPYAKLGSLGFAKKVLTDAKVAVSPASVSVSTATTTCASR